MTGELYLRAVEPEDLEFLYELENDQDLWEVSNTRIPFSKNTLQQYLSSVQDIYTDRQLRLVICVDAQSVGAVDLFDYDPFHQRAGVGIVISKDFQQKGLATVALKQLIQFCSSNLGLRLLFCNILSNNQHSIALFEKASFFYVGNKKYWHRSATGEFIDELMYQLNLSGQ